MQGAAPQTLHVSAATDARNSMIPFQSEPRRADSRRHHSRDLGVVAPPMTAALPRVAELMMFPQLQARYHVETWMCVRQRSCDFRAGEMLERTAPSATRPRL
jgi:hypothetical protein